MLQIRYSVCNYVLGVIKRKTSKIMYLVDNDLMISCVYEILHSVITKKCITEKYYISIHPYFQHTIFIFSFDIL